MTVTAAPLCHYAELDDLLASDPDNPALIADTAEAAYAERRYDVVALLLDRHAALAAPTLQTRYLCGMIAMARQEWPQAIETFEALRRDGGDAPPLRFNLAWSLALARRKAEALVLLDDDVVGEIPTAAQLKVGLLHDAGQLDAALAVAHEALARFPEHRGLNAAVSTLAIDAEDLDLARTSAARAGDHPEAMMTAATLALGKDDVTGAARLFDAVLASDAGNARALVGRGLVALAANDAAAAAADFDRGAATFGTHLGSWLAAGWAHFIAGDVATARARFESALTIDDTFAEAHGSLAVVRLTEGDVEGARRDSRVALKLDPASFAGALAAALLADGGGDPEAAERIVKRALHMPVDAEGRTIAQALARAAVRG